MLIPLHLLESYVTRFNAQDVEHYTNSIPNEQAYDFLKDNIPLFECPDPIIESTYYFRWWTYRKHIRQTEDGAVITEFLPEVPWAQKHNVITCPSGHHVREGRWLRKPEILREYMSYLLKLILSLNDRTYSYWAADSVWAFHLLHPDSSWLENIYPDLCAYFERLQSWRIPGSALYHYCDMLDGMEHTAGGRAVTEADDFLFKVDAVRPSFNSYMFGDAIALSKIAKKLKAPEHAYFESVATDLRREFQNRLWNTDLKFFTCLPEHFTSDTSPISVREQVGYIPWYFNLPESRKGYEQAWDQLMDPDGFYAPFGPTTCEQRHPFYRIEYFEGCNCQWNGPSWPFATSQTLTALANVLNSEAADQVDHESYFKTLKIYAHSHQFRESESVAEPPSPFKTGQPWIDENLDPQHGNWISRERNKIFPNQIHEQGKDYNHSTFCDLIINGLIGIRPENETLVIHPLLPPDAWDWFCLENVPYQGKMLTVIWDKTGTKYNQAKGMTLQIDGFIRHTSNTLQRVELSFDG